MGRLAALLSVVALVSGVAASAPLAADSQSQSAGCSEDSDRDGLSNVLERVLGSDVGDPDTDGDGLVEGVETRLGTDPLEADSDGDGLRDAAEFDRGTNPLARDTGEGGTDSDECRAR